MPLVNVANRTGASVLMQSTALPPHGKPEFSYKIVGNRDPGAVAGYGITFDVDEGTYNEWVAANPSIARSLMLVTDEQIAAAQNVDPMTTHGFELGLVPPVEPPPGSTPATAAVLTGGTFSDEELAGLVGDVGGNPAAWLGFDLVVDGALHTLRMQFIGITSGQDIADAIDRSSLGAYAATTLAGSAGVWSFVITSNTTGSTSTLSYGMPPSFVAVADGSDPMKATTDISAALRIIAGIASLTQGADAASEAASAGSSWRLPASTA